MPDFSQLWTGEEFRLHEEDGPGYTLCHAASNRFNDRGVRPGDRLYVWSFIEGHLLLIGRMEVDAVVSAQAAGRRLGIPNYSSSLTDHAIARTCTNMRFDNEVPLNIICQLVFVSPDGTVNPPRFRTASEPDPQTFRGVRQLPCASAVLLETLL